MITGLLPPRLDDFERAPVPYTGNPLLLCWSDILLFAKSAWAIPGILLPWIPWHCGELDELYLSVENATVLVLHGVLLILHLIFFASLPFLIILPVWIAMLYVGCVFGVTWLLVLILNGRPDVLHSTVDIGEDATTHHEESWIYLNGVMIGHHWVQVNLDRLAYTFRRPMTGVHNRTYGVIIDLIQCIVERNFCFATSDVRRSYAVIKESLLNEEKKKVVLILHSQGGIEGSLVLDWLLSELPHDVINKLEIYTFGSAANHFNNPPRCAHSQSWLAPSNSPTAVRHIEHYANDGEFVARWGVLTFARMQNRYMGRVFIRPGTGHLLNQHYLTNMFPLDKDNRVMENNEFMGMDVSFTSDGAEEQVREGYLETMLNNGVGSNSAIVEDRHNGVKTSLINGPRRVSIFGSNTQKHKVRKFSRLWRYRNGRSPED